MDLEIPVQRGIGLYVSQAGWVDSRHNFYCDVISLFG